jgi:uncharacterized membrane protein (UPF0127 family)
MKPMDGDEARRLRRVRRLTVFVVAVTVLVGGGRLMAAPRRAVVLLGEGRLVAAVADTEELRSRGLEGVRILPDGEAMLFVNDRPEVTTMAMKSVSFPIDVAFVGPDLRVTNVGSMQPDGLRELGSAGPARYIVEVNAGWLRRNHVDVGDSIGFVGEPPR